MSLEPIMEAVSVPGTISGSEIVDDVCSRIADRLSRDCNLRASDCYGGYAFTASVEIQLLDVYPVTVSAQVAVGALNRQLPSQHVALGSEVSGEQPDSAHLEKPIDPEGFTPQAAAAKEKRIYVSAIRTHK
jgi:hypothetical protein